MPSTSKKQHNFMEAIAHSPPFAKKVGVSQSVGKDFSAADKGKKFVRGGAIAKQNTQHGKMDMPFSSLKQFSGMKGGGNVKYNFEKSGKDVEKKGMKEGSKKEESFDRIQMKYAKGGSVMRSKKDIARDQMAMAPYAKGGGIESKGKTQGKMIKMATGGIVKFARGGGIESRGKTRGKMC